VRILLAEDHTVVRAGLRALLEKEDGMEVVAEASDGREAVQLAQTARPDVVVMDVTMPGLNGIEATRAIVSQNPRIRVVGLSMNSDRRYILEMLSAGAVGYVLKSAAADDLVRALHSVHDGRTYFSRQISDLVVKEIVERPAREATSLASLSGREREVLQLLAEGRTSKEIAVRLDIAASTVESHRQKIMDKLNLRSVAELTKYAVREGLTPLE
jgi:DNA-binding NarL/FixJ family response regulator